MNENNVENQEGVQNNVTSSNIAPKGKLLPKIYNGAKKAGDIARKAFNFIKKAAKLALKVGKFLVTHPYIALAIAIVIIVIAVITKIKSLIDLDRTSFAYDQSITTYTSTLDANNVSESEKKALDSYETTGNVMDFTTDALQSIKDAFEKTTKSLSEKNDSFIMYEKLLETKGDKDRLYVDIKNMLSFEMSAVGIVEQTDKRTLFEHILLTSKYDFNRVKWKEFSHTKNGDDSQLKVDSELGVRYPDDSTMNSNGQTKYSTFSDLLKPYLLTYEVPMSIFSGFVSDPSNSNEAGDVAYAIVRYGLSDITVNRFDVQKYILSTYFYDFDYDVYSSAFDMTLKPQYVLDSNGNSVVDSYEVSFSNIYEEKMDGFSGHFNICNDENGNHDAMKETQIDENTLRTTSVQYYVSNANLFDVKLKTDFTYVPFSDSNAENRTEFNSIQQEEVPIEPGTIMDEENVLKTINNGGRVKIGVDEKDDFINYIAQINGASRHYGKDNANTITFLSDNNYTKVTQGETIYVTRTWEDKLTKGKTEKEFYTYEDLINYNTNFAENPLTSEELLEDKESSEYYNSLANMKVLNRFDFLNSNPYVFKQYYDSENNIYSHVGYNRNYMNQICYVNLKRKFSEIRDKNDNIFPYLYGETFGFGLEKDKGNANNYYSGVDLLRRYIHTFEGDGSYLGGGRFDENYNHVYDDDLTKYYKVYDAKDGVRTVGYGVNMDKHAELFLDYGIDINTITYGDFIESDIVDKIENKLIEGFLNSVKDSTSDMDLTEYQIHALTSHCYLAGNIVGFRTSYDQSWNKEGDELYDSLYSQYKDNQKDSAAIMSNINFNHKIFNDFFGNYNGSVNGKGKFTGWETREKSEFTLFQGGYYSTLGMFWTNSAGTPGNFQLVSGDTINGEECLNLQAWFEDNIFSSDSRVKADSDLYSSDNEHWATNMQNYDGYNTVNKEYEDLIAYKGNYFQCPWWSSFRANMYLNDMGSDKRLTTFSDGKYEAQTAASELNLSLNETIDGIRPYSIISFDMEGSIHGHTAFVEAVTNDSIVISHCGSGKYWHGVTIVPKDTMEIESSLFHFYKSVCITDAL